LLFASIIGKLSHYLGLWGTLENIEMECYTT